MTLGAGIALAGTVIAIAWVFVSLLRLARHDLMDWNAKGWWPLPLPEED